MNVPKRKAKMAIAKVHPSGTIEVNVDRFEFDRNRMEELFGKYGDVVPVTSKGVVYQIYVYSIYDKDEVVNYINELGKLD